MSPLWSLVALASARQEVLVCPPGVLDPGCAYQSLQVALLSGNPELRLRPGDHPGGVQVGGSVTLRGDPGARIVPPAPGQTALQAFLQPGEALVIEDLVLDGRGVGPVLHVDGGRLEVRHAVIRGGVVRPDSPSRAGGLEAWLCDLTVGDTEIVDNGGEYGGGVWLFSSTAEIVDSRIAGNRGAWGGGILAQQSSLEVLRTRLEDNEGVYAGGHLLLEAGAATLTDCTLRGGRSSWDGLAIRSQQSELRLIGGRIEGSAPTGTAASVGQFTVGAAEGGALIVEGTTLTDNRAGAIGAYRVPEVTVQEVWICANEAERGAGVDLWESCATGCEVTGSVLQANAASDLGAGLKAWEVRGPVVWAANTVLGNTAAGSGSAVYVTGPVDDLEIRANLFVDNVGGGYPIDAPARIPGMSGNALTEADHDGAVFTLDPTNVVVGPPVFEDGPAPCGRDVRLARVPDNDVLLDGRQGAFPDDCGSDCVDHDGDGFARRDECADQDPAVYPGAEDPPFDGIDQNCDGIDGFDGDGDGLPYRLDCDDTDPDVLACLEAVAGGGGCRHARVGGAWAVALALLACRRRR